MNFDTASWQPNFKKRCVWCWVMKRGRDFREVGVKRFEVCLDCEKSDPKAAASVTKDEAKRLRTAMRGALQKGP